MCSSEDLKCNVNKQEMEATCTLTIETDNSSGERVTTSLVATETDLATRYIPAVIMEGAEKLGGGSAATSTGTPGSTTSVPQTGSSSGTHTQGASSGASTTVEESETSATETPAASSAAIVENNAVVRKAQGVVVGLAALVILTMLA